MKKEEYKCRWAHCQHGGIVKATEAVRDGNAYYHQDCLEEKKTLQKIAEVYLERVDPRPIFNVLHKTINDIVFKDGFRADYFLFALNYCLDAGWNLRHVHGLRYVVRDPGAQDAWDRRINISYSNAFHFGASDFSLDTEIPQIATSKPRSFADILGR